MIGLPVSNSVHRNLRRPTRVLFTGGSSPLGAAVLRRLIEEETFSEFWCGVHKRDLAVEDIRVRRFALRLDDDDLNLDGVTLPVDLVVHFAGVTHAQNETLYAEVNYRGTMRLAEWAWSKGCRRFVHISTRCATTGSGAYGESKLAAESGLMKMDWESLVILRPSEIYGGGSEGVDKFLTWARRFHLVPLLFGNRGLRFAPLYVGDLVAATSALLAEQREGVHILDICGPEELSGVELGLRIARKHRAVPIPAWWPLVALTLRGLRHIGIKAVTPDQIARLVGPKTASQSSSNLPLPWPMSRFPRDRIYNFSNPGEG